MPALRRLAVPSGHPAAGWGGRERLPVILPGVPAATAFRAYDIRGLVPDQLDSSLAYAVGLALAAEARERGLSRIAVGRDGRRSSPRLQRALVDGLAGGGMQVIDVGRVTTPVLYYAAHELADGSGAMVTGSHNPASYNGVKLMLGFDTLAGEAINSLYQRILAGPGSRAGGSVVKRDVVADYIARIAADVHLERPLRVVIDCGNGVAGAVAPRLFRRLGCEVSELYCGVDGRFPHHEPDPSQPENLEPLRRKVMRERADIGIAFDGDGDRLGVVAGDGQIVWADRLLMTYAQDLLRRCPGAAVMYDVKCSGKVGRLVEAAGGRASMCPSGHSPIKALMRSNGAHLAGELSGHIYFRERWYGFDDGLYAAARLLEILAADGRPAVEVLGGAPEGIGTPELRIAMAEGEQHFFMERLMGRLGTFPGGKVSTIDGVRLDYEDRWGLVRASNTTPSLILRFEADSEAALHQIQDTFRQLLLEVEPRLAVPF